MNITTVFCSKCGLTSEYEKAVSDGWLIAPMVGKPNHMVIRCPKHITDHARRLAGLRQEYYHQKKGKQES
jgi:hypothetical protein